MGPDTTNQTEGRGCAMRSPLLITLALIAVIGNSPLLSAMSEKPKLPMLRTGGYFIAFGSLEIVNVSKSYAYSLFVNVERILTGADRTKKFAEYSSTDAAQNLGTVHISCRIERVFDTIKLSVSLVKDSGETYFASEQKSSFFSPDILLQDFDSDFSARFETPNEGMANAASAKVGFAPTFGGLRLGPVFYLAGESGLNYEDALYDIKMTPQLPHQFVEDFESFITRKTIEGVVFYGSAAAWICTLAYWAAVSPNERPSFSKLDAPTLTMGLFALSLLAAIPVMADLPYRLIDKLNAWWQSKLSEPHMTAK